MTASHITPAEIRECNATGRTPVVFVHGLWLLPSSWDRWAERLRGGRLRALTPGWPDDPETVEEAQAHPEVFAHKTVGQVADHFAEVIGELDKKPAVIGHSLRRPARPRSSPGAASRRPPSRSTRRRSGACCRCRSPRSSRRRRCSATRPTATAPCRSPTTSSATRSPTPSPRTRPSSCTTTFAVPASGRAALPGRHRQPQPVDRGEGRHARTPTAAAADHLRREGPHRAVGDRNASYKKQKRTRVSPRSSRSRPRPLADDRQRLARGRRHRARLRPALRRPNRFESQAKVVRRIAP